MQHTLYWGDQLKTDMLMNTAGATSTTAPEDSLAFHYQIDEVDRAVDNLVKSGKFPFMAQNRRDSMPMSTARPFVDFGTPL